MPTRIKFNLRKRFTNEVVGVELVDDVDNDDAVEISKFNQRSKFWKILPKSLQPDDLEWQWNRKADRIRDGKDERWIIVMASETSSPRFQVLGLLVLSMGQSAVNPSLGVAYIKLLAVNPKYRSWDFGFFRIPGQVKGVGIALLHHAQTRAITMTGRDCVGLHALGRSEKLYIRLGLQRITSGDKDGQPYYEGTIK